MMKGSQKLEDLALDFVQGSLSPAERTAALQLMAENADFRQLLTAEFALQKAFKSLQRPLPAGLGQRVYWGVIADQDEMLYRKVLHCIMEACLPAAVQPILKLVQRSVFTDG